MFGWKLVRQKKPKSKKASKTKAQKIAARKKHFANFIVVFSILTIITYTSAAIYLQYVTHTEISPTLTTCFFGVFGIELASLAGIKISKTKNDWVSGDYTNLPVQPPPPTHSQSNQESQE